MNDDIVKMKEQIATLTAWMEQKKVIQLTMPVDDTSRLNLRVISDSGLGTHAVSQNIVVSTTPQTIAVPAAFTGTLVIETPSGRFEIPYF